MYQALEFETPILELEGKIEQLRHRENIQDTYIIEEIERLQTKIERLLTQIYTKLTPWQKVQIARHPARPRFKDYIKGMIQDFTPLAGDRLFAEDQAIIGGLGRFEGMSVMIMGHERGADMQTRLHHNFGMARPEGYRKVQRLMDLADRMNLPIIFLVDTAGAHPGVGAEARGQSEAIARSIEKSIQITTPIISIITGEGGSGGAIAMSVADSVMMLEHAVYSVISPEGCASILWRSANHKIEAAEALKITAQDLYKLKIIDHIIKEPLGAAHRSVPITIENIRKALHKALKEKMALCKEDRKTIRREKFLTIGRHLAT